MMGLQELPCGSERYLSRAALSVWAELAAILLVTGTGAHFVIVFVNEGVN